mmetsp:Transcript_22690/g.36272  ORF Transcript_22690/g.36272 Transcript_22690/m.36272 type:complete len:252 (-) Transcript_22690:485-1240(-)
MKRTLDHIAWRQISRHRVIGHATASTVIVIQLHSLFRFVQISIAEPRRSVRESQLMLDNIAILIDSIHAQTVLVVFVAMQILQICQHLHIAIDRRIRRVHITATSIHCLLLFRCSLKFIIVIVIHHCDQIAIFLVILVIVQRQNLILLDEFLNSNRRGRHKGILSMLCHHHLIQIIIVMYNGSECAIRFIEKRRIEQEVSRIAVNRAIHLVIFMSPQCRIETRNCNRRWFDARLCCRSLRDAQSIFFKHGI